MCDEGASDCDKKLFENLPVEGWFENKSLVKDGFLSVCSIDINNSYI